MKDKILKGLHDGVITVSFTTVGGERRDMKCTLNEKYLPANVELEDHPDACTVWDTEKDDWRRFRWDSVITSE